MLGFPQEDADIFRRFIQHGARGRRHHAEEREAPFEDGELDDVHRRPHRGAPRRPARRPHDVPARTPSSTATSSHPDHVRGTMVLLMIAGIDTTWSAIGASLWHLAQHPDDRKRLGAEPELMDTAVEEFLRAYAPVTMARLVAKDFEFDGCPMKEGDWVLLPFPAANRDPERVPRRRRGRASTALENRHAAFGLGIHRCLGSNLARMELRVALEEWMARYPDFELTDPAGVTWSAGQVRGPRSVPVRIL